MTNINYEEALQLLEDKLTEVYQHYELETTNKSRGQISQARDKIDLSLEDKQTLKEHFRDIVHSLDATGDQSKVSLFYGGGDYDGKMGDQIAPLQDDFRNITNTEVGKFMTTGHNETLTVKDFYTSVFGHDFKDPHIQKAMLNFKNEQWIPASVNYAKATQGDALFAVGENALMRDIMYGKEYQTVESEKKVTSINGVEFDETYRIRPDEIKLNQFKVDTYAKKLIDKPKFLHVDSDKIETILSKDPQRIQELADFQKQLFEKTHIAKEKNIPYDEMFSKPLDEQNKIVERFYQEHPSASKVLSEVDSYHTIAKVGKYGIVGAVALSVLPENADASTIPTLHLHANLPKDSYENLSKSEQIGAQVGVGFNAINTIQASQEFKEGASKSAKVLLDADAYKQGLQEATQAWKPNPTQEVVKLSTMESAKFAGKSALKKLPLIGLGAGIAFGIGRAMDGDFNGAAMEIASGAVSIVPGWGTAASVGIDAALLEKDTHILSHGMERVIGKEKAENSVEAEDNPSTQIPQESKEYFHIPQEEKIQETYQSTQNHDATLQKHFDYISQKYGSQNDYDANLDMGMERD